MTTLAIDAAGWGVIIAAVTVVVGTPAVILSVKALRPTKIAVQAFYDKTGMVQAIITKKGPKKVRVRAVTLLRPGTMEMLIVAAGDPLGSFDIEGDTGVTYDCFFGLENPADASNGVVVRVRTGLRHKTDVAATKKENSIVVP